MNEWMNSCQNIARICVHDGQHTYPRVFPFTISFSFACCPCLCFCCSFPLCFTLLYCRSVWLVAIRKRGRYWAKPIHQIIIPVLFSIDWYVICCYSINICGFDCCCCSAASSASFPPSSIACSPAPAQAVRRPIHTAQPHARSCAMFAVLLCLLWLQINGQTWFMLECITCVIIKTCKGMVVVCVLVVGGARVVCNVFWLCLSVCSKRNPHAHSSWWCLF